MSKIKRAIDAHHNVRGVERPARSAKREDGEAPRRVSENAPKLSEPLRANRGVIEQRDHIELVLADGKVKQILKRGHRDGDVFLDWLSATVNVPGYLKYEGRKSLTDDDIAASFSSELEIVLGTGFGISKKNGFGMHFYKESYVIGQSFGLFCIGHRSNKFLFCLSGEGWLHAPVDAGQRLFHWLSRIDEFGGDVRVSRIDLAVDFYHHGPSHDEFKDAYQRGAFVRQERHINSPDCWPHYQVFGCVHTKRGREKGITDAVGVRTGDLYLRRYDKGKAEGDPDSTWVRVELEMKSKNTIIPLEMLLQPEIYFCQYPWLKNLRNSESSKLETKTKRAEINIDDSKKIIKNQFGKYLRVLRGIANSTEELLDELQSDEDQWPDRLAKIVPGEFVPFHKRHKKTTYEFNEKQASSETDHADDSGYYDGRDL